MKPTCIHCGQPQQGSAHVIRAGVRYPLCHTSEGMDCYRLVTVEQHLLLECPCIVEGERWMGT